MRHAEPRTSALGTTGVSDCPRCHGGGEVKFNPSRSTPKDPQLEDYATCPDCMGDGIDHGCGCEPWQFCERCGTREDFQLHESDRG